MSQSTFDDFLAGSTDKAATSPPAAPAGNRDPLDSPSEKFVYKRHMAPEPEGECCPWCHRSAEHYKKTMKHNGEIISCGYCEAVIPLSEEWYQRGELVTPRGLAP